MTKSELIARSKALIAKSQHDLLAAASPRVVTNLVTICNPPNSIRIRERSTLGVMAQRFPGGIKNDFAISPYQGYLLRR